MSHSQASFFKNKEQEMTATILMGSPSTKKELSKKDIMNADRAELFLLTEKNSEVKKFCQEEGYPHTECWSDWLKRKTYPFEKITSISGKEISIFDLYLGAFLYDRYMGLDPNKNAVKGQESDLNAACDKHSFSALEKRVDLNITKLKSNSMDLNKKIIHKNQIIADLDDMGEFYLSMGHFHAAIVLLNLGHYCLQQDGDDPVSSWASELYDFAAKHFYHAKALENCKEKEDKELTNPQLINDKKLIDILSDGEGLKIFGMSWQSAEDNIVDAIKNIDEEKFVDRITKIKKEASGVVDKFISPSQTMKLT
jgi:hypothetical protein